MSILSDKFQPIYWIIRHYLSPRQQVTSSYENYEVIGRTFSKDKAAKIERDYMKEGREITIFWVCQQKEEENIAYFVYYPDGSFDQSEVKGDIKSRKEEGWLPIGETSFDRMEELLDCAPSEGEGIECFNQDTEGIAMTLPLKLDPDEVRTKFGEEIVEIEEYLS